MESDALIKKISDLRLRAKDVVDASLFDYVDGGADDEITLRENREQWRRLKLIPRSWTGNTPQDVDIACQLWGHELGAPLLIAPMAVQMAMHKDGDIATAKGAQKCNIPMCISLFASKDVEDIKHVVPNAILFQQMYTAGGERYTEHLLKEFYRQGTRVIILTIDCPVIGNRERDLRNNFDYGSLGMMVAATKENYWGGLFASAMEMYVHWQRNGSDFEWEYIRWMKRVVDVKIVLKGILSPVDAELAVEHGVDGIIVSNHGGRQLDTVVTVSDVLPMIAKAVNKRIPILADGGIQRGSDIIKALALGASAVLIGRPILYALAADGEEGVEKLLKELIQELKTGLSLCGCKSIKDITSDLLHRSQ